MQSNWNRHTSIDLISDQTRPLQRDIGTKMIIFAIEVEAPYMPSI